MNDNDAILAELRKISAWFDMQRKVMKWTFIFIAVFLVIMIVTAIVMENRLKIDSEPLKSSDKGEKPTWGDVDWNVRGANLDEAIRIGEDLIQKMPQYPEGHHRLASAYLAAGKIEQARQHYAEAFRLFPSEENEKALAAVQRRVSETQAK